MTIGWLGGGAEFSLSSSSLYSVMRALRRPLLRLRVPAPSSEAAPSSPPRPLAFGAALSLLLVGLPPLVLVLLSKIVLRVGGAVLRSPLLGAIAVWVVGGEVVRE